MHHVCTHVPHLDLIDIGQNVFATVRLMATRYLIEKDSNRLMLWPQNPKILRNVPHFCPGKILFILTLHTHRKLLDWPLISILTSQPIHETCSGPWKTSHMFSIYKKTVNHKTSWKVSFGSYRGPLQIPIDIGPMSLTLHPWKVSFGSYRGPLQIPIDIGPMSSTLHAINGWLCFSLKMASYSSGHNLDSGQHRIFLNFH